MTLHRVGPVGAAVLLAAAFLVPNGRPGGAAAPAGADEKAPVSSPDEEATAFEQKPLSLPAVTSAVLALAASPDGQILATVQADRTVHLRVLPKGEIRCTLT